MINIFVYKETEEGYEDTFFVRIEGGREAWFAHQEINCSIVEQEALKFDGTVMYGGEIQFDSMEQGLAFAESFKKRVAEDITIMETVDFVDDFEHRTIKLNGAWTNGKIYRNGNEGYFATGTKLYKIWFSNDSNLDKPFDAELINVASGRFCVIKKRVDNNTWKFENDITVKKVDYDYALDCFNVYHNDKLLGTIYPDNIGDVNDCVKSLDSGSNPIEDKWEDGLGHVCTLDGWSEND